MARRPQEEPRSKRLNQADIKSAQSRLRVRLDELEAYDPRAMANRTDPRIRELETKIRQTVTDIFGADTPEWKNFINASRLDHARHNVNGVPDWEILKGLEDGKAHAIGQLTALIQMLQERVDHSSVNDEIPLAETVVAAKSADVFIVHGHDESAKQEVARFVEKAGLRAVILHEQPNKGATVIEKLERHGNVGFAVVLLTPDDVGGPQGGEMQPRARQNVVAELFYFIARLGRERVCPLIKGKVEIPSDIGGVVYTDLDARGAWKQDLLRELSAVGFEINWAKALS